jgi:tRNA G18 (ribose-2'-O)-methylase SpoU
MKEASVPLVVAEAGGVDVARAAVGPGWALVVGSEARGVRPEVQDVADLSISVPMPGGTDSLNAGVAGAILIYALWRGNPNV